MKNICPFCKRHFVDGIVGRDAVANHIESKHSDQCEGLSGRQVLFNYRNRYDLNKKFGKQVISGKPTKFNEFSCRYDRFLPEEKELYREYFKRNMKKAGKEDIMKDMEHQKEMLAARHISGEYIYNDGTKFTYTGSYEKKFIMYLDKFLNYQSSSIMMPAPQLFTYKDPESGEEHVHIPDCYLQDLNCIVNIKSQENKHYRLRDIEMEKAQDVAIEKQNFNYIKIYDNNFEKFTEAIDLFEKNPNERILIESFDDFQDKQILAESDICVNE